MHPSRSRHASVAFTTASYFSSLVEPALLEWNISAYERIAQRQAKQNIVHGEPLWVNLTNEERDVTRAVLVERTLTGPLLVEVYTEGDFSVKHRGFVFTSAGLIEPGSDISSR